MKRIRVYEGAAILYDPKIEKDGVSITANTKQVEDVNATPANLRKYIQEKKYPNIKNK